jgi:chromosome segregation ATPase
LEYDNERLRSVNMSGSDNPSDTQLQAAEQERDEAVCRIAQLDEELLASENTLKAQRTHTSLLEQDYQRVTMEVESLQLSRSSGFEEMQKKLDDSDTLAKTLKDAADRQAIIAQQQEALCKSKDVEIATLELRIENAYKELQDEKTELGAQIEELRMAGQVCPAYLCRTNVFNHLLKGNHRSL